MSAVPEPAGWIDVLIVAYRSRDDIASCVMAARSIVGVHDVVVVDHGDDGSGADACRVGARVIADPSNPGFGAGQNRAMSVTDSPYVVILNPDAHVCAEAITDGVSFLEHHPDVAVVQGAVVSRRTGQPERSQGRELGPLHLLGRAVGARRLLRSRAGRTVGKAVPVLRDHVERTPEQPTPVSALAATAWLARRAALEGVGGFDAGYFLYGEDLDLCRRLRAVGWQLVALPDVWATHDEGSSAGSPVERELAWWAGTMRFAACWWSHAAWSCALGAAVIRWVTLTIRRPKAVKRAWCAIVAGPVAERRFRTSANCARSQ